MKLKKITKHNRNLASQLIKIASYGHGILLFCFTHTGYSQNTDPDITQLIINPANISSKPATTVSFINGGRAFADNSIWNSRVDDAYYKSKLPLYPRSSAMIRFMSETTAYTDANGDMNAKGYSASCRNLPNNAKIRLAGSWIPPIHIVNASDQTTLAYVKGEQTQYTIKSPLFNKWDTNRDYWLDSGQSVPLYTWNNGVQIKLWGEPTYDGHIILIDPNLSVTNNNTSVIDPPTSATQGMVWEMSHYHSFLDSFCGINEICSWGTEAFPTTLQTPSQSVERATVSTFTQWTLAGNGYGNLPVATPYPNTSVATFWQHFGGRGSGVPVLGGVLRLAEFNNSTINHALAFSFPMNRTGMLHAGKPSADIVELFVYPPAVRNDGQFFKNDLPTGDGDSYNVNYCQHQNHVKTPYSSSNPAPYPLEGMRLRLKHSYVHTMGTVAGSPARKKMEHLITTLKNYGMFLIDNGGPMAVQIELLATPPDASSSPNSPQPLAYNANQTAWLSLSNVDIYQEMAKIPVSQFEVLGYGLQSINPTTKKTAWINGKPYMMSDNLQNAQPCCWKKYINP